MRENTLGIPFTFSLIIHGLIIALISAAVHNSNLRRQDFLPISLVQLSKTELAPPLPKVEAPPSPAKLEKSQEAKPVAKNETAPIDKPALVSLDSVKEEPAKTIETKPAVPMKMEPVASLASSARPEDGGSEAGAGNLFGKGDVGIVPGTSIAGGGGGTAAAGLGRGAGAQGLPAQQPILRTNREAKAIQTARATYPAMALRAGLESDVTLKIEVDPYGNVIKADIVKSGGAGFDEEALKAVKQSRFEPAQREGQNVPAEFTFIYRFRLQR